MYGEDYLALLVALYMALSISPIFTRNRRSATLCLIQACSYIYGSFHTLTVLIYKDMNLIRLPLINNITDSKLTPKLTVFNMEVCYGK